MRPLFSLLRSAAPFLFAERGSLALTRSLRAAGQRGRTDESARAFGNDVDQRGLMLRGEHEDISLPGARLADCDLENATVLGMNFDQGHWSRSVLRRARLEGIQADSSTWDVVDLQQAQLKNLSAQSAHLSLVSFRDAQLADSRFDEAHLCLCDFSGANLVQVSFRGARLSGCDFDGAILEGVNLTGADLSGCMFRDTWCGEVDFAGAILADADFRGAAGLSPAERRQLEERGAKVGGGWVYRLFERVLGTDDGRGHRRVLRAVSIAWATLAVAVPIAFFVRAIVHPIDPENPPGFDHHQDPGSEAREP